MIKYNQFCNHTTFNMLCDWPRVDMSKALQLAYTLHPKTLTNPLLAYSLTKPLTLFKSMYFLQVFVTSQATNTVQR